MEEDTRIPGGMAPEICTVGRCYAGLKVAAIIVLDVLVFQQLDEVIVAKDTRVGCKIADKSGTQVAYVIYTKR